MATGVGTSGTGVGISDHLSGFGKQAYTGWYNRQATAAEPAKPEFSSGVSGDDLISQMKFLMGLGGSGSGSSSLNYALYTPQEMAQRGLALNGSSQGALDSQGAYLGRQGQNNTLQNQLAGQDIGAKAAAAKLQAAQDRHTAQGQFAANGAIGSEASRQALGSTPSTWKITLPWQAGSGVAGMGGSVGDIQNGLNNTNADLYRQLVGTQGNYDTSQAGIYNQLAQLAPQYMKLDQSNDANNRLLNGQYNTNVSPEMRALMAALSQSGG